MLLKDWMRSEGVDDAALAERIGDLSKFTVRSLRFQQRTPSVRVAARIEAISAGKVRLADLLPAARGASPLTAEAHP